ncbi:unnamed protein product, partial [Ceratitis capitata]
MVMAAADAGGGDFGNVAMWYSGVKIALSTINNSNGSSISSRCSSSSNNNNNMAL